MTYRCLACGSTDGEEIDAHSQNWFWRVVQYGRIGPFCTAGCASGFNYQADGQTRFTLEEWERLHFLKWRTMQTEVVDVPLAPNSEALQT